MKISWNEFLLGEAPSNFLFIFVFWPCCAADRILVPWPGTDCWLLAVKAESEPLNHQGIPVSLPFFFNSDLKNSLEIASIFSLNQ